jgi:hypothetical protein
MALTMRPAGLAPGSTRTARTTPCSAASGILAASMKFEAVPSIYVGFGRCTSPTSRRAFARITAWPETAKGEFEASWRQWLAWAKLGEVE